MSEEPVVAPLQAAEAATGGCDVCLKEPMIGVASIPGMPISVAYGRNCLDANAHPWWALVGNAAMIGGLDHAADWFRDMVEATCRHLGKTLDEFNAAVTEEINDMEDAAQPPSSEASPQ